MVAGAIQVPPDGNPVVLLADHAVTGGYPVVAVVISADLPLIAQARPGTSLRFAEVTTDEAAAAWADAEALYSRI
jgi:allophanate hydrolase subunit 2